MSVWTEVAGEVLVITLDLSSPDSSAAYVARYDDGRAHR